MDHFNDLPALPPALHDALHEVSRFSQANPDLSAHLLVDPLLVDPLAGIDLEAFLPQITREPLRCVGLWPDKDTCPVLYALSPERHGALLEHAFRCALAEQLPENRSPDRGFSICGLLFSRLDAQRTASWLARKTELVDPRGRRHFFGYFDRRVLLQLPAILGEAGMAALLGPLARWYTVDRMTQWQVVVNATTRAVDGGPLQYPHHVWESLGCIEAVNLALDQLVDVHGDCDPSMEPAVWAAVQRALHRGVASATDRAAFAVDAFRHHDLEAWPEFADVLDALRRGLPYTRARTLLRLT